MQGWVDRWDSTHDPSSGTTGRGGDQDVRAVTILSERTGLLAELAGGGVPVPKKTIENVLAGRSRHTELRIADALVAAVEQPEAFHDGTLRILPNPNAAPAVRATCCGGSSLTG